MAEQKEKSVKFAIDTPKCHAEKEEAEAPNTASAAATESAPVNPTSAPPLQGSYHDPNVDISKAEGHIVKDRIGARNNPKYVYCHECQKEIPISEWPDHRDRLRKVKLVAQVSTFHHKLIRFIGEFLMWILRTVYFREVTVVGAENIPPAGAVVFYGNHQNQFIDALMMNSNVDREVRFLMAEKSLRHPIMGVFGRMFNSVAVIRPQDVPLIPGEGKLVSMHEDVIAGEGSRFTECFDKGDVITWFKENDGGVRAKCTAQVQRVLSDTQLEVTVPIKAESLINGPTDFKFSRRIDHSEMYAQVYDTLQKNHCIGIFPEGGSHDHTSLLPLKAGVALFSLGAAERNISVKIVPCGLTYFYGHKFRSRAYIEFGEPVSPPDDLVALFSTDKRKATGLFLEQLNKALRGVTINVPDWRTLNFLHSFRQLYQPLNCTLSARDHLRLMRRLGVIIEQQAESPSFMEFRAKVENYSDYSHALLVRDSQTATLKRLGNKGTPEIRLLLRRAFTLFLMGVILIPFFVVGLPIGCFIEYYATKKTRAALAASSVKIVGADVKGSFKVLLGFVVVPFAFLFISFLVLLFTDAYTALVVFICLPMAMYVSLLILQEAVMELRAALPLFMSLLSKHKQFMKLYNKREGLAKTAREIVHEYDPQLEQEMGVYMSVASESDDDLEREPSLFSLRYNVRRRLATNS